MQQNYLLDFFGGEVFYRNTFPNTLNHHLVYHRPKSLTSSLEPGKSFPSILFQLHDISNTSSFLFGMQILALSLQLCDTQNCLDYDQSSLGPLRIITFSSILQSQFINIKSVSTPLRGLLIAILIILFQEDFSAAVLVISCIFYTN